MSQPSDDELIEVRENTPEERAMDAAADTELAADLAESSSHPFSAGEQVILPDGSIGKVTSVGTYEDGTYFAVGKFWATGTVCGAPYSPEKDGIRRL